jgi:hypothetical protein
MASAAPTEAIGGCHDGMHALVAAATQDFGARYSSTSWVPSLPQQQLA